MGSGWSSDTSSQSSDCESDPHEHLATKDDVSVTPTAEFNTAGHACSSSHSLIEQPKPYMCVDTPQEATEGLILTKHSATGGSCAWSIDLSDWAGKRKKIRREKRPKVTAGRTATCSQTEPACEKGAPTLLPVVELRDDCEYGKLAVSPEDLSSRKFLDLKRWYAIIIVPLEHRQSVFVWYALTMRIPGNISMCRCIHPNSTPELSCIRKLCTYVVERDSLLQIQCMLCN